jgi:hypothetical protein
MTHVQPAFAPNKWPSRWIPGLLIIGLLVSACGTDSPSNSVNASLGGHGPSTSPVHLPAGVQFSDRPETLPKGTSWAQTMAYSADGSKRIVIGTRAGQLRAAESSSSGQWQDSLVDDGSGLAGPAGYPENRGLRVSAVASGAGGFVAVGSGEFWTAGSLDGTNVPMAWFSADGAKWRRIDLSTVAGPALSVSLKSVAATGEGFVAIGDSSSRDLKQNDAIVVLTSTNGLNWTLATTLKLVWALDAGTVVQVGENLLAVGGEEACVTGGFNQIAVPTSTVFRAWSSSDGGKTWVKVDSTAGGLFKAKTPMPATSSGCPPNTDANYIQELFAMFGTSGGFVGVANTKAVFVSGDGSRVSATADLKSFSLGSLAGAIPAGGVTDYLSPKAQAVVADGSGIALLSLQARRDSGDRQSGVGSQVVAWTSRDASSWTRLPPARPLVLHKFAAFFPSPNGSVALMDAIQAVKGGYTAELFNSVSGNLQAWGTCRPAKGADCSFSRVTSGTAGADLSGTDFTGATISSSLAGAKLSSGRFEAAVVPASIFAAADLAGVDLLESRVLIAKGDKTAEKHDFGSLDLTGMSFDSAKVGAVADMKGADFSHATLSSTDFGAVDLTGAIFPKTATTSANFVSKEAVCPDGKPPSTAPGIAACRVGPAPATP